MPVYFYALDSQFPSLLNLRTLVEHAQVVLTGVSALTVAYAAVVRHLRFRRVRAMEKKYERRIQEAIAKVGKEDAMHELHLTPEEAQEILHVSYKYDHSSIMSIGRGFALFKSYGIPSIARLLYTTGQFATSSKSGSKRLIDTAIATDTWLRCPIVTPAGRDSEMESIGNSRVSKSDRAIDPRNAIAIARINWLHSKYKIRNDDYIYVLAALFLEPMRLADRFSWHKVTPLEREAYFVYWKEICRRMEIKEIPESLEELITWAENYEQEHMVPNEISRKLAKASLDQMASSLPTFLGIQNLMRLLFKSVFEERTRQALMFPRPHAYIYILAKAIANVISFRNAYFSLPKRTVEGITPEKVDQEQLKKKLPRMNVNKLRTTREPWYLPEPKGLESFISNILLRFGFEGALYAPGPDFKSEGYRLEELGPLKFENDGHDEVMKMAAKTQGCPVVGPWAR